MPQVGVIIGLIISADRDLADCDCTEGPVRAGASEELGGWRGLQQSVHHIWNQHVCLQERGRGGGVTGSDHVSFQSAVLLTTTDRYFIPSKSPTLSA